MERRHIRQSCSGLPPQKSDPYQTRLTVRDNLVAYPGDCGTLTVDLLLVKLLLNRIISTPGAKFMTIDIKDFYLNTPRARYKYMRLKLCDIPEDVTKHYKLATKVKMTDTSTLKSGEECTDSPNRDSSPNSYCKSNSTQKETTRTYLYQVFGLTLGAQLSSLFAYMIWSKVRWQTTR